MKPILVAVIYLVSLVTASSAQVVGAASTRPAAKSGQTTASGKKASKQGPDTDLQETLDTQVKAAVKKAEDQQDDTYWVNKGAAMVEKECSIRGMNCALEKLFEAEKAVNGNVLKAVVCLKDGSECVPALAYGQGAVHYAVQNLLYYRGQLIVETSPQFVELVTNYGLHSEADRQAAKKYFFALMQRAYKDCDSVSANEDTSRWNTRRTNYCAEEISSMAALAMIAKNEQERKQVASGVYSLMKDEYDAVGGGIIMTGGTVALGVLGTQDAYAKLERFLTQDTIPGTAGNVWEGINSPIKSATQNSYKASRKDGRYLNRINEKFLYLDKEEARKQGFSNTAWQSAGIQYPYANTLEDVGFLLGQQSAENGAAKRLATQLVRQANQYAKNGEQMAAAVHYPLVVGILDGWRQINNSMNVPSKELITLLYKGNWFDINEGTQRRVHRKAYEFGLRRNMVFDPPAKDPQKIQDYITYSKAEKAASVADVAAQFVLLDMLVTKLPALAKGIPNAVRVLKQRSAWVGTKDFIRKLPRTSSLQKAKAGTQAVAKQPVHGGAAPKATPAKPQAPKVTNVRATAQQPRRPVAARTQTHSQPATQAGNSSAVSAAENAGAPARQAQPKAAPAEPKTEAVSPTRLQAQVTGPLEKRVQEGKSATENIKAGAEYVGGLVQDYFKALVRPSNTLMMSIPGVPAPEAWQTVRAEREVTTLLKKVEGAAERAKSTTQVATATRYAEQAQAQAQMLARMAKNSPHLTKAAEAAEKAAQAAQEAQEAAEVLQALEARRMKQAIAAARSDDGIFTPLRRLPKNSVLQAIDPLATRLPMFQSWIPIKEQTRMLQGIINRFHAARQSFPGTVESIQRIFAAGNITPSRAMENALQALERQAQACAADATLDQMGAKINSLLDQIASAGTEAAQKRQLFTALETEQAQFAARLDSYHSSIREAAQNVYKEIKELGLHPDVRNGIQQRVSTMMDLTTDEVHFLDNIRSSFMSALSQNIGLTEQKAQRVATAAANKAAKQTFKAGQRARQSAQPGTSGETALLHQVTGVGKSNVAGVYPLADANGQVVAYAKVSDAAEIARTQQVAQLLGGGNVRAAAHLEIDYPRVLAQDLSPLSSGVQETITKDIAHLPKSKFSRGELVKENRHRVFVMSSADTRGMNLGDMNMLKMDIQDEAWLQASPTAYLNEQMNAAMLKHLAGKPITQAEWTEVKSVVENLNRAGFEHGDLGQNLFIRRNPQTGKLKITLIDFEVPSMSTADATILSRWEDMLHQYQVLVP